MSLRAFFATIVLSLFGVSPGNAEACRDDRVSLRGDFGVVSFTVELALTPQEQARGLMFRETMGQRAGMLFVFPRERDRAFWMRNTYIPLDILFYDKGGRLLNVATEAVPLDETPLPSNGPARYVLEINGGLATQLGFAPGDVIQHPRISQKDAAWPCS